MYKKQCNIIFCRNVITGIFSKDPELGDKHLAAWISLPGNAVPLFGKIFCHQKWPGTRRQCVFCVRVLGGLFGWLVTVFDPLPGHG